MQLFENLTAEELKTKITEFRTPRIAQHVDFSVQKRGSLGERRTVVCSECDSFDVGSHNTDPVLHWVEFPE